MIDVGRQHPVLAPTVAALGAVLQTPATPPARILPPDFPKPLSSLFAEQAGARDQNDPKVDAAEAEAVRARREAQPQTKSDLDSDEDDDMETVH
jgi:hypothetical protein